MSALRGWHKTQVPYIVAADTTAAKAAAPEREGSVVVKVAGGGVAAGNTTTGFWVHCDASTYRCSEGGTGGRLRMGRSGIIAAGTYAVCLSIAGNEPRLRTLNVVVTIGGGPLFACRRYHRGGDVLDCLPPQHCFH